MSEEQITKKKSAALPIIIAVAVLAVIGCAVAGIFYYNAVSGPKKELKKQLELGDKYLAELDYEKAILAYEAALTIDPKNVAAFSGIISAYRQSGDYDSALAVAQRAFEETQDESFRKIIDEITSAKTENPEPEQVVENPEENAEITPLTEIACGEMDVHYEFDIADTNPGARAMCYTTFTYDAPVAVEFRIAEWREIGEDYTLYEEKQYTAKEAAEIATLYEEVWTDLPESVAQSGEVTLGRPVYDEDKGKVYNVLFLARDSSGKIVGYAQSIEGVNW